MSNQIVCCHTIKVYIWFVFIIFFFVVVVVYFSVFAYAIFWLLLLLLLVCVCVLFRLFVFIAFRKTFLSSEHTYTYYKKLSTAAKMCKRWTPAHRNETDRMYNVYIIFTHILCTHTYWCADGMRSENEKNCYFIRVAILVGLESCFRYSKVQTTSSGVAVSAAAAAIVVIFFVLISYWCSFFNKTNFLSFFLSLSLALSSLAQNFLRYLCSPCAERLPTKNFFRRYL